MEGGDILEELGHHLSLWCHQLPATLEQGPGGLRNVVNLWPPGLSYLDAARCGVQFHGVCKVDEL